jgi:hypothetical protein
LVRVGICGVPLNENLCNADCFFDRPPSFGSIVFSGEQRFEAGNLVGMAIEEAHVFRMLLVAPTGEVEGMVK